MKHFPKPQTPSLILYRKAPDRIDSKRGSRSPKLFAHAWAPVFAQH